MTKGVVSDMRLFFNNHYEKIILVSLLVIFVILLIWQVTGVQATQRDTVSGLINQKEPDPDYPKIQINFASPEFDPNVIFSESLAWVAPESSDPKFADFLVSSKLAFCPKCMKLIPSSAFPGRTSKQNGVCPNPACRLSLLPMKTAVAAVDDPNAEPLDDDINKNGISDKIELAAGLDLNDPQAIHSDLDKDGFSFYEEYLAKTNPLDPKSHPSYRTKFFLHGIIAKDIAGKLTLTLVNFKNPDKKKWETQFNANRIRSQIGKRIGDTVVNGSKKDSYYEEFEIIDIEKPATTDEAQLQQEAKVILRRKGKADREENIIARTRRPIKDPCETIAFQDTAFDQRIELLAGNEFSLGTPETGIETYLVMPIEGKVVKIKEKSSGKVYLVPQFVEKKPEPVEGASSDSAPVGPILPDAGLFDVPPAPSAKADSPRRP